MTTRQTLSTVRDVMDTARSSKAAAPWRVIGWWAVTLTILVGMLAGVLALGWHAPTWAQVAAGCAAIPGLGLGAALAHIPIERAKKFGNRWWVWAAVGISGPLLANSPDRVTVIVMSFLMAVVVPLLNAERRRIRSGGVPFVTQ